MMPPKLHMVKSAGAEEYTDCISTERLDSPNECHRYKIKKSDGEVPIMLELWEMLPGLLWPGVVISDRVLSMSQIELFDI